jgi:4-hydroxy-2-oxoheptanedioate aldolase
MPFLSLANRAASPHLGLAIMYPAPGVVERIGAEWDWIWLDGQHGQIGYDDMLALVRACDLVGRPAFVRVPGHDAGAIGLALDMGAAGVIVPCVDTLEQAQAIVTAAKFPPTGNRSYGGRRPIDLQGRAYCHDAKGEPLLVVQIESPLAVSNAEAIAALPGVDALFLGPDDILLRRGVAMDAPRTPDMLRPDLQAVVAASHKHGKGAVTVGVLPEMLSLCLDLEYDMVVAGGDVGFLASGSQQAAARAREARRARRAVGHAGIAAHDSRPTTGIY